MSRKDTLIIAASFLVFAVGVTMQLTTDSHLSAQTGSSSCTEDDVTPEYPSGNNPRMPGTTSGPGSGGAPYTGTDVCNTNGTRVTEYFCSPEGVRATSHACPNGCEDGACVGSLEPPPYNGPDVYDLAAQIYPERGDVRSGETVKVTMVFRNNGPRPASQIIASVFSDGLLSFSSISDSRCVILNAGGHPLLKIRCAFEMPANSQIQVEALARVGGAPDWCGTGVKKAFVIPLTAQIGTDGVDPKETNITNNRADAALGKACGGPRTSFESSSASSVALVNNSTCGTFSTRAAPDGRVAEGTFRMQNTGNTTWRLNDYYFGVKIGTSPLVRGAVLQPVTPNFSHTAVIPLSPVLNQGCTYVPSENKHRCPIEWGMYLGLGATAPFGQICKDTILTRFPHFVPPASSAASHSSASPSYRVTCTDTDATAAFPNGRNVTTFGVLRLLEVATGYVATHVDTCVDANTLRENYCTQNHVTGQNTWADPVTCIGGCVNGRCVGGAATGGGTGGATGGKTGGTTGGTTGGGTTGGTTGGGGGGVCADSDGGLKIKDPGFVTYTGLRYDDLCLLRTTTNGRTRSNIVRTCTGSNCYIREGSCRQDRHAVSIVRCTKGCDMPVGETARCK